MKILVKLYAFLKWEAPYPFCKLAGPVDRVMGWLER